jgi:hypothetical protein
MPSTSESTTSTKLATSATTSSQHADTSETMSTPQDRNTEVPPYTPILSQLKLVPLPPFVEDYPGPNEIALTTKVMHSNM